MGAKRSEAKKYDRIVSSSYYKYMFAAGAFINTHLLGHASVKTTERAYAAFVRNERFKQTIDLLDTPSAHVLNIVK